MDKKKTDTISSGLCLEFYPAKPSTTHSTQTWQLTDALDTEITDVTAERGELRFAAACD
jgi:hypothetical protein